MTRIEKLCVCGAAFIISSDLLWLGIPAKVDAFGVAGLPQDVSAAFWAAGLCLIVAPYVYARTRDAAWIMSAVSGGAAYAVALVGFSRFDTPIFTPHNNYGDLGPIVGTILMTWSMAGAFSLLLTVRELYLMRNRAPCVPRESLPAWLSRAIGPN